MYDTKLTTTLRWLSDLWLHLEYWFPKVFLGLQFFAYVFILLGRDKEAEIPQLSSLVNSEISQTLNNKFTEFLKNKRIFCTLKRKHHFVKFQFFNCFFFFAQETDFQISFCHQSSAHIPNLFFFIPRRGEVWVILKHWKLNSFSVLCVNKKRAQLVYYVIV